MTKTGHIAESTSQSSVVSREQAESIARVAIAAARQRQMFMYLSVGLGAALLYTLAKR